jgi:Domain of Unknown Function (DUF1206)
MSHSNFAGNLARLGYVARGAVYLIIGGLALLAGFGSRGRPTESKGALQIVLQAPSGRVLLAVIATGFLCFSAWRVAQAFLDADQLGRQRKALMRRWPMAEAPPSMSDLPSRLEHSARPLP